MPITPVQPAGLPATGKAIQSAQRRFDDDAAQVTADTLSGTGDGAAPTTLTSDLVAMQADSIANSILYGVFKRQDQQQQELADLLKPTSSQTG